MNLKSSFSSAARSISETRRTHVPHSAGRRIHGFGLRQALSGREIVAQKGDHGLGQRQVSAGQDDKSTFSRLEKGMHLGAHVHLVEAGVGSGIGRHDQALMGHDAQTIGHYYSPT